MISIEYRYVSQYLNLCVNKFHDIEGLSLFCRLNLALL